MSDIEVEVITAEVFEDNYSGVIIDGTPYLYWYQIYSSLGLSVDHAGVILKKLTPVKHFISFTRAEIKEIFLSTDDLSVLPAVRMYHFLTAEGLNRAIMEISTGHMNNSVVAAAIDAKKDHIASIYTRYQKGEVLSKAYDETPALPGEVATSDPVADAEKKIRLYNTARKIAISLGADRRSANIVMIEKIKEECPDVHPFMAMIPLGEVQDAPDDAVLTRQEVSGILKVDMLTLEDRIVRVGWAMKSAYGWLLTPKGSRYLKPDPHTGEKRAWYDVRFGLDAVRMLKAEFEQQLLTGGFISAGSVRGAIPVTGAEKLPVKGRNIRGAYFGASQKVV